MSDRDNTDNQRETALQVYFDKMSELLLIHKLRASAEDNEIRKIARARTLTVLPRLDRKRKRSLLQFLYESCLIEKANRIVDLTGVDLSGADLSGANLNGTIITLEQLGKALSLKDATMPDGLKYP